MPQAKSKVYAITCTFSNNAKVLRASEEVRGATRLARVTPTPLWTWYRSSPDTPSATAPVKYR